MDSEFAHEINRVATLLAVKSEIENYKIGQSQKEADRAIS